MPYQASHISYLSTNAFSPLVLDYLQGTSLASFYSFSPRKEEVSRLINSRSGFGCDRALLVQGLKQAYEGIPASEKTLSNIELLLQENAFTICTAHQPNMLTGPLYFVYKILHVIQLADELSKAHPAFHFVPLYYMGSEDADINELGVVSLNGKEIRWNTAQKGAVGRMQIDEAFMASLREVESDLTALPFGKEVMHLLFTCYRPGISMEAASFRLVNELFGRFGLVIFTPDRTHFKAAFVQEMMREMEDGLADTCLRNTLERFPDTYKIQAKGRAINLFYLKDDVRERIEKRQGRWGCPDSNFYWEGEAWKQEMRQHPERFSPNVIMRPLFQEKLLPNIIFVGGGGELSYWLELKEVFEAFGVHYPMLLLRNSFLLFTESLQEKLKSLQLDLADLFLPAAELEALLVRKHTVIRVELKQELEKFNELYDQVLHTAGKVDVTLQGHASALKKKAIHRLEQLEKKMLRAEKRKFSNELSQAGQLKEQLFPVGGLQERKDNIMPMLATHGFSLLDHLLEHSLGFEQRFTLLEIGD